MLRRHLIPLDIFRFLTFLFRKFLAMRQRAAKILCKTEGKKSFHFLNKRTCAACLSIAACAAAAQEAPMNIVKNTQVGTISIQGADWFPSSYYREAIRLQEGGSLSLDQLGADLAWINSNPYRHAEAVCRPGSDSITDIEILVQDKRPFRLYAGTDNTGYQETGYLRLYTGVSSGNLWGLGHLLSYQYTADDRFRRFQSHVASYDAPCSWRHRMLFFGGVSFVRAPLESTETVRSEGNAYQASGRYAVPFSQGTRIPQEIRFGIDFKRTNNNLNFGGNIVSSKNANIFQLIAEYRLSVRSDRIATDFSIETVFSPGQLLGDMSPANYATLRSGAKPLYFYVRGGMKQTYFLPRNFSLRLETEFQLSTARLLASEQFGLGGYQTVRGYQERAVNADDAFLLRLESCFPTLHLASSKKDSLVFFLFSDAAIGFDQLKLESDFRTNQGLWGVGPGLRYCYKENIQARVDWGWQILHIQNDPAGNNRFNFGVTVSL